MHQTQSGAFEGSGYVIQRAEKRGQASCRKDKQNKWIFKFVREIEN